MRISTVTPSWVVINNINIENLRISEYLEDIDEITLKTDYPHLCDNNL